MNNLTLPLSGITLNAVTANDANVMVTNFVNNPKSSHSKTAIWLSKTWIDSVFDIIKREGGDGIRIYFATTSEGNNTVVIVSTYFNGIDLDAETKQSHHDYFTHDDPFFTTPDALFTVDWSGQPGATLFNLNSPCTGNDCVETDNYISCDDAYTTVTEFFRQGANQLINTYSEWFPLSFIETIKNDLANELTEEPGEPADGIRIYFAKHTDTTTDKPSHKNRHAFIIVTTKTVIKNGSSCHQDNYKCYTLLSGDNGEQCPNNCNGATLPA